MVAEISGAGVSHSLVAQAVAPYSPRIAEISRPLIASSSAKEVSDDVSREKQAISASQVVGAYAQLRDRQEALNSAASLVREVGNTADKASQLLIMMESELGEVVKMYPPYPVDSPERVQLLNNFGGLRKQIESLTFPPAESLDAVGRLLSDQVGGKSDENVDASQVVKNAALVKEPMWDIPALDSMTASDADVRETLDQVKSTKFVLEDLQKELWKDVVDFVKQLDISVAENNSAEIRSQFVKRSAKDVGGEGQLGVDLISIGQNQTQLSQAAITR